MSRRKLESLDTDQVDLTRLPSLKLATKARSIMNAIATGTCYTVFKGKRMRYNRSVVSVPVNRDYRIIYDMIPGGLTPRKVMSHEEYNSTKPAS